MAFLAYNFPLDQADKLTYSITRTTAGSDNGTVDASARVIDLGLMPPAFNVNTTSVVRPGASPRTSVMSSPTLQSSSSTAAE